MKNAAVNVKKRYSRERSGTGGKEQTFRRAIVEYAIALVKLKPNPLDSF